MEAPSNTTYTSDTTAVLACVKVVYCAEEPQARRLLAEMSGTGLVAIDIETAPIARRGIASPN
jgi:hypothetical protein